MNRYAWAPPYELEVLEARTSEEPEFQLTEGASGPWEPELTFGDLGESQHDALREHWFGMAPYYRLLTANAELSKKLGWKDHMAGISKLLGLPTGYKWLDFFQALHRWQCAQKMFPDTLLEERTWERMRGQLGLNPYATVDTNLGPRTGPGYYAYALPHRQFGYKDTIRALKTIAERWAKEEPCAPRIGIGDISFCRGGKMDPHNEHQRGFDVDLRPFRRDGMEQNVTYKDKDGLYVREWTRKLVEIIRSNGVLDVKKILFNDRGINEPGKALVTAADSSHDYHLHVSFVDPRSAAKRDEDDARAAVAGDCDAGAVKPTP